MHSAIIVAAGQSQRMGFDKLFAPLGGKPVVVHSLEAFDRAECVDEIILVGRSERIPELEEIVRRYEIRKVRHVLAGGRHRQDSVRAGLAALSPDVQFVAVHDGARPFVTVAQIGRVLELAREHGAAALAQAVTDTLKRGDNNSLVSGSVDRDGLFAMQTPQIFARPLLAKAYDVVAEGEHFITDEVSAMEHIGAKVFLMPNEEFNLKITFPRDLLLGESFLAWKA